MKQQKNIASKLKKSIMACGAAMLLAGMTANAQLYSDFGTVGTTTSTAVGTGYVGIGTSVPLRNFHIENTNTTANNTWFMVMNNDPDFNSSPGFAMQKGRGAPGAPAICQNGDRIGFFLAAGYDGDSYRNSAGITMLLDDVVADNYVPGSIVFETGDPRSPRLEVASDGRVTILNIAGNIGECLVVDTDGSITTTACGGTGGGSNWDAASGMGATVAGAGEGHIWFTAGTDVMADTHAVSIEFNIEADNSHGLDVRYSGGTGDTQDPKGVYASVEASSGGGYGIGVSGYGNWYGGWFDGDLYAGWFASDVEISGDLDVTGTITSSSDRQLKENITDMEGAMTNLSKLSAKEYDFKTDEFAAMNLPEGRNFGFIAQELQEVFPNLVKESTHYETADRSTKFDFLSVDYTSLVPVVVSAIQENQTAIDQLSERLNDVEEALGKRIVEVTDVESTLGNSFPNPAIDKTSIPYSIDAEASNAQIAIYDAMTGRLVQTYTVKGAGNLEVTGLNAGHYNYTLYVNDVKVATKKLVVVK